LIKPFPIVLVLLRRLFDRAVHPAGHYNGGQAGLQHYSGGLLAHVLAQGFGHSGWLVATI